MIIDISLCPVCDCDHSVEIVNCDYEVCGECGYDHAYEPQHAHQWHQENDVSDDDV